MSASLHRNTPTIVAFDPRGLTVRTLAYHRVNAQTEPQPRISRQVYGASGFVQQQWDPRQYAASAQAPRARACETLVHSLSGTTLLRDSADAGRRLMLLSEAGQLLRTWDNRGACQRYAYDTLQRPVAVFEQAADEPRERCRAPHIRGGHPRSRSAEQLRSPGPACRPCRYPADQCLCD